MSDTAKMRVLNRLTPRKICRQCAQAWSFVDIISVTFFYSPWRVWRVNFPERSWRVHTTVAADGREDERTSHCCSQMRHVCGANRRSHFRRTGWDMCHLHFLLCWCVNV